MRHNGKLLAGMGGQLRYIPEWWRCSGGLADKVEGSVPPTDKPDMFAFTRHEPVGVLAGWWPPLPGLFLHHPGRRQAAAPLRAPIATARQVPAAGDEVP